MKFIRFLGFLWFLIPCVSFAATSSEFQNASRLLTAARRGDIQTVQVLINAGADINYVDSTGMSLVCTAVMNNDTRAIQILQMYGADASSCDRQIKNYKQKKNVATRGEEYGFFSGLSSTHVLALSAVAAAAVIGGVVLLADVFDDDTGNGSSSSGGSHSGGGGGSSTTEPSKLFTQNLPYGPACSGTTCPSDFSFWQDDNQDFTYMSNISLQNTFNYLMVSHAYDAFVRGYLGMATLRIASDKSPFNLSLLPVVENSGGEDLPVGGGKPVNVATITGTGVNPTGSAADGVFAWIDPAQITTVLSECQTYGSTSSECQTALADATSIAHKYYNYGTSIIAHENTAFDLSGEGTVFGSATAEDTKLAKIIAGWEAGERADPDFYGYIPNGQLTVYRTGNGLAWNSDTSEWEVADYKNYTAIYDALTLTDGPDVVANLSLPALSSTLDYATVGNAEVWISSLATATLQKNTFGQMIDSYYDLNTSDSSTPSDYVRSAYTYLGNHQKQILVNPAGRNVISGWNITPLEATFENYAPAVYTDLENLFMTVVALKPSGTTGTQGLSIDEYNDNYDDNTAAAGKLELSVWYEDPYDTTSTKYTSRTCGLAGTGNGGEMNPWCFAAPGNTDLEATASMAGSVALVKSAFNYMDAKQIFLLLALTADGPYLGTDPSNNLAWKTKDGSDNGHDLISYLRNLYALPVDVSDEEYLSAFKNAYGYGMINLERATRPSTNIYYFSSNASGEPLVVSKSGDAYWRKATTTTSTSARASNVFSLTNRQSVKVSFYDVIESSDGSLSLPRVWNTTLALGDDKHALYMGDVLSDFSVDSTNKRQNKIGKFSFDMTLSPRAYNDNMNGLDNLRVALNTSAYDLDAEYQRHFTDGESRFNGRANGVLGLVSNAVSTGAKYKMGDFAFGTRAFSGYITDENLLENDPAITSQFEPGRLGFANGIALSSEYNNETFGFGVAFGNMNESNTLLGSYSEGLLSIGGANTQYVDATATYKPFEKVKLFARATFANTHADINAGLISSLSDIKSDAYSVGLDMGGLSLTASMPLAVTKGKMGYNYADLNVVENDNAYTVELNNAHIEYIDLASDKREVRFAGSYKQSVGTFTDAGVGFIYRVNPNNTAAFGNESIFMFKVHHRLGI